MYSLNGSPKMLKLPIPTNDAIRDIGIFGAASILYILTKSGKLYINVSDASEMQMVRMSTPESIVAVEDDQTIVSVSGTIYELNYESYPRLSLDVVEKVPQSYENREISYDSRFILRVNGVLIDNKLPDDAFVHYTILALARTWKEEILLRGFPISKGR